MFNQVVHIHSAGNGQKKNSESVLKSALLAVLNNSKSSPDVDLSSSSAMVSSPGTKSSLRNASSNYVM